MDPMRISLLSCKLALKGRHTRLVVWTRKYVATLILILQIQNTNLEDKLAITYQLGMDA